MVIWTWSPQRYIWTTPSSAASRSWSKYHVESVESIPGSHCHLPSVRSAGSSGSQTEYFTTAASGSSGYCACTAAAMANAKSTARCLGYGDILNLGANRISPCNYRRERSRRRFGAVIRGRNGTLAGTLCAQGRLPPRHPEFFLRAPILNLIPMPKPSSSAGLAPWADACPHIHGEGSGVRAPKQVIGKATRSRTLPPMVRGFMARCAG